MEAIIWPTFNAGMNFIAFVCLMFGRFFISRGRRDLHKYFMSVALASSAIFLISYLTYHFTGTLLTTYEREGFPRYFYFTLLISHSSLAAVTLPGIVMLVRHVVVGDFVKHKKLARWIWPIWSYVSGTGVLVYVILYHFNA